MVVQRLGYLDILGVVMVIEQEYWRWKVLISYRVANEVLCERLVCLVGQ